MRPLRLHRLSGLTGLVHNRTVRLAVTGLSGSGKTAFITSLVSNLLNTAGRPGRFPFLRSAAERRIISVGLLAYLLRAMLKAEKV